MKRGAKSMGNFIDYRLETAARDPPIAPAAMTGT
jgi:hypothetical protein